jgi:hypothetical protein
VKTLLAHDEYLNAKLFDYASLDDEIKTITLSKQP